MVSRIQLEKAVIPPGTIVKIVAVESFDEQYVDCGLVTKTIDNDETLNHADKPVPVDWIVIETPDGFYGYDSKIALNYLAPASKALRFLYEMNGAFVDV